MNDRKYVSVEEVETIAVSSDEQEVSVNFYRKDDKMRITVSDNTFMTKLCHVIDRSSEDFLIWEAGRDKDEKVMGYNIECPKSFLHISPKRKDNRVMTEEQKEQASERLKKYWEEKKSNNT